MKKQVKIFKTAEAGNITGAKYYQFYGTYNIIISLVIGMGQYRSLCNQGGGVILAKLYKDVPAEP